MAAQDNLNKQQFVSVKEMGDMYSGDFDGKMSDVRSDMRSAWQEHVDSGYEAHPKDIEFGGPDKYIHHLAKDIKKNGVREPITVRGENVVTSGHHRYAAAVEAGLDKVPVEHTK